MFDFVKTGIMQGILICMIEGKNPIHDPRHPSFPIFLTER